MRSDRSLSVSAPTHVDVGQPIEIDVLLHDAPTVAGFEASVRYDEAAAEFGGVVFGDGSASGNVVSTITTDPVGGAAVFRLHMRCGRMPGGHRCRS